MADLFWLSDEQWAVMVPFMPNDQPGPERKDDGRSSPASCTCSSRAAAGVTAPPRMVLARRSKTASIAGPGVAFGRRCWRPWPRPAGRARRLPSTAPTCACIARRTAGKGGEDPGHRPVARGGQTTKVHALTDVLGRPGVLLLTPGNRQRCHCRSGRPGRSAQPDPPPERRQGLRRRLATVDLRKSGITRSSGQARPQAPHPPRQTPLPRALAHRGDLQPPQGLPPHRHSLRQACPQLRLSRRLSCRHRLLVLIESKP